ASRCPAARGRCSGTAEARSRARSMRRPSWSTADCMRQPGTMWSTPTPWRKRVDGVGGRLPGSGDDDDARLRARRVRRDPGVRLLRPEHLVEEAAGRRRALQRRVEERGLHHLGETVLLVGGHGRVRRKWILAGERTAGPVDAGPPTPETLEDVALLRDAGERGAADPVVALRGRAREVGHE